MMAGGAAAPDKSSGAVTVITFLLRRGGVG